MDKKTLLSGLGSFAGLLAVPLVATAAPTFEAHDAPIAGDKAAEKGAEHTCGEGSCGGAKDAEKKCGADKKDAKKPDAKAEKKDAKAGDKAAEHTCGEGSCGGKK